MQNWSRIFMFCIFHSCKLVLHFHVPQFPPVQTGAANSCLAFSSPALLTVPYFHVSHFQSPRQTLRPALPILYTYPTHDLYISSDEKLFNKILTCPNHILQTLLPPPTAQNYSLRNRPHNRQLPDRISRITDCNFTVRMLYRNMY